MKHYFRLDPSQEANKPWIKTVPEVLIFLRKFVSKTDYQYPQNYLYQWFRESQLIPLSQEEKEAYLENLAKVPLDQLLIKAVGGIHGIKDKGGVNSFAYTNKVGERVICAFAACYAQFNTGGATEAVIWDSYRLSEERKKEAYELYHWLMNDSPWLHCIHPSWDILSAQERTDRAINGPVYINLDAPANEVGGFAVAMRTLSEYPPTIRAYLHFRKEGASKPLAFMLAGFFNISNGGIPLYIGNGGGHHYTNHLLEAEGLIKFFKVGYHLPKRAISPASKGRYTYIARQIAEETDKDNIQNYLSKFITYSGEGWEKKISGFDTQAIINDVNRIWENV